MPADFANFKIDLNNELKALKKAIDLERKAYYTDLQGKKTIFSLFVRRTAAKLTTAYPNENAWLTIRGLMRYYSQLDVSARISVLRKVEKLILDLETHPQPPLNTAIEKIQPNSSDLPASINVGIKITGQNNIPNQLKLNNEIQYLKGVGPKNASLLNNLGITTIASLIKHYPKHHIDFLERKHINDLNEKEFSTIIGIISSTTAFTSSKSNLSILTVNIKDTTGVIAYVRFIAGKSNKFLLDRMKNLYPKDALVMISGMVERDKLKHKLIFKTAQFEILSNPSPHNYNMLYNYSANNLNTDNIHVGRIVPVYTLTDGLSLKYFRQIMFNALNEVKDELIDPLPQSIINEYSLIDYQTALTQMHFPDSPELQTKARTRLVFDELFNLQLKLLKKRQEQNQYPKDVKFKYYKQGLTTELVNNLPFKLTNAQIRVFNEIALDMASDRPMYRLVQGDVGSGKTVVSLLAHLLAIENGYQGALMAPTEILAQQHYRQFQQLLLPLGLRVALLVGKLSAKQKTLIKQDLCNGLINIVVGTQALLEDDIEFNNLGLIVIDEQHRFGVKQRSRLKSKAKYPELLTMTATPIPRTLALTLHGDLDISEIDELPPNRKPVNTSIVQNNQKKNMFEFIGKQIINGRQVYIVFPLIEESETISAKAATQEYEILKQKIFPNFKIGLMHGKLKVDEKDLVMEEFRKKNLDILVSTTVIEVGVDVPNATIMVIENANRFGLAQLHQLRGRVGRGSEQSYCFLIGDSSNETALARLDIMTKTNDGFVIAQKDLEIRGPGEFLGVRQSGIPDLLLTDLSRDAQILTDARKAASQLLASNPTLSNHPILLALLNESSKLEEVNILQSG